MSKLLGLMSGYAYLHQLTTISQVLYLYDALRQRGILSEDVKFPAFYSNDVPGVELWNLGDDGPIAIIGRQRYSLPEHLLRAPEELEYLNFDDISRPLGGRVNESPQSEEDV